MNRKSISPNDKLSVAIIGFGIQGRGLTSGFLWQGVNVAAICDVDTTRRLDGVKRVDEFYKANPDKGKPGDCKAYNDFRDVLARDDIDMVCIATPDHWHAYITIAAMAAGKDVYCEKPLTYSVDETVKVMAATKKYNRILQVGAMQRSAIEFRTACELVRNGCIGKVKHVECSFGGPSRPHFDPKEDIPMEPGLDWDMWCGGAPLVKYNDQLSPRGVHNFYPMVWRMDDLFGIGYCGDWGAHHLDIAQWGLDMDNGGPVKVIRAERSEEDKANVELGGRAQSGAMFVFDGGVTVMHKPAQFGAIFHGSEGSVSVDRGAFEIKYGNNFMISTRNGDAKMSLDEAIDKARKIFLTDSVYKTKLYDTGGSHIADFISAVKSRKKACSNEDVGGHATILCQLLNISYVHDASFDWDPTNMTFANGTGDTAWLVREGGYRNNWTV